MKTDKTIVYLSHYDGNLYLFRLPIMREMIKNRYKVIALVPYGDYNKLLIDSGIDVVNYYVQRESINPFKEIITIYQIYKKLLIIKPNILHTFTAKPNLYGSIAGKFAKINKIFITVTGLGSFFIDNNFKSTIVRTIIVLLYKISAKIATKVLFQNSDDLNYFIYKNIVDRKKTVLIGSSGIDTSYWQNSHKKSSDTIDILFVGRVIIHKGIVELLEAFLNLAKKYNDIYLTIVGDVDKGNHFYLPKNILENLYSSANIKVVGWQENTKKYYENSDIFILPSYREGVPRTVLEAMSMSLAIITTNTVGCKDTVIHNQSGLLVPIKDSKAIKNALELLINSPDLREKFGKNARKEVVNSHDIQIVIKGYLALYSSH